MIAWKGSARPVAFDRRRAVPATDGRPPVPARSTARPTRSRWTRPPRSRRSGPADCRRNTGSWRLRPQRSRAVRPAWGPAPRLPVVSTLAEDVDRRFGDVPDRTDRASGDGQRLIGGAWYTGPTATTSRREPTDDVAPSARLLRPYGADDVPDILGVALGGSTSAMARTTRAIASELDRAGIATTFVVAAHRLGGRPNTGCVHRGDRGRRDRSARGRGDRARRAVPRPGRPHGQRRDVRRCRPRDGRDDRPRMDRERSQTRIRGSRSRSPGTADGREGRTPRSLAAARRLLAPDGAPGDRRSRG